MFRNRILTASVAAVAAVSALGTMTACSSFASTSDAIVGDLPLAASTPSPVVSSSDRAPGGSTLGQDTPRGAQADKATQVHMSITNNTQETLNLSSASSKGTTSHWQDRPVSLAPGQKETVSNYAAGDAEINLTYTGATSGTAFTLHGETPSVGDNQASGTTTSTNYITTAKSASGFNPTFTYSMEPGHTFTFVGHTDTYTVPPGVTQLNVTAVGGAGGVFSEDASGAPDGAEISGVLAVTPGEILTVGVAGQGNQVYNNVKGGWGMTNGASDYAGGNGFTTGGDNLGGGGGATVILDGTGSPVVVAGGGGGDGDGPLGSTGYGGEGGQGGSLLGGTGGPYGQGGKPGANTVSHGQDAVSGGGAGGGGVNGGTAGNVTVQGGGAGSSSDSGLTNTTIKTAASNGSIGAPGTVIITGVTS
jgi:hypothetical protein